MKVDKKLPKLSFKHNSNFFNILPIKKDDDENIYVVAFCCYENEQCNFDTGDILFIEEPLSKMDEDFEVKLNKSLEEAKEAITTFDFSVFVSASLKFIYDWGVLKISFILLKDDVNDCEWSGGDTGDEYFDEMSSDDQRFSARVEDVLSMMAEREFFEGWEQWNLQYIGDYNIDDFI